MIALTDRTRAAVTHEVGHALAVLNFADFDLYLLTVEPRVLDDGQAGRVDWAFDAEAHPFERAFVHMAGPFLEGNMDSPCARADIEKVKALAAVAGIPYTLFRADLEAALAEFFSIPEVKQATRALAHALIEAGGTLTGVAVRDLILPCTCDVPALV